MIKAIYNMLSLQSSSTRGRLPIMCAVKEKRKLKMRRCRRNDDDNMMTMIAM